MKTILITGASGGIGSAISKKLINNYNIVLNYNKSKKEAIDLLKNLREINPMCIAVKADVTNEKEVDDMFNIAERNFSKVDILINNAGISNYGLLQDTSYSKWNEIISTNLNGTFLCSKRALKSMISNKYGVIINVSSIWGKVGASNEVAYSSSKGAINIFTKALSKEVSFENIRVNAIAPGVVDTNMMKNIGNKSDLEFILNEIPAGRFAKPDEIADAIEFLISDKASYITGEILDINGGFGI
ncbi:MAG: 3-oxoacyl-ACP reductase FabG [Peptoniphilaceae bacterium]|nr:3-oxoacyl-ACP reductase FabG [Peptoniphilaceae bacterium]MDD7383021.1 3-oxoacyl-ACP reductase FabG [Peptoniphilaceae bacterium]MDY3737772.1 3-oxoacyl-ACP reductase FabG [Peptoniphilaceae bacterium]